MLNRRNFLRSVGLAAIGMTFDPERLLWVQGRKTFFIPPPVASQFCNSDILDRIMKEGLKALKTNLVSIHLLNRFYDG